ncbi:MAG: DUF2318 domain-containing protein [Clostridiales bacterium]|jgi:uncharacterized membrane protein|nr:DUF2318 domain-containing protein [Clostridiales bacterium]
MVKKYKRKNIFSKITLIVIPLLLVAIIVISYINDNTVRDNDLIIHVSDITEQAKFYPVEFGGTDLTVLAVKASDGSIRTAFNTCHECFNSGRGYYRQEGSVLVCQNCGNRFNLDGVEIQSGGCNPVPITADNKTVTDSTITISKEYFEEARQMFESWR